MAPETKVGNAIWVAWENHRRNKSLSSSLGVPLFELDYRLPRFLRYAFLPWITLALFLRKNPRVIFVQNPSLVLALTATLFGRLTSKTIVVDAHNAGLLPLEGESSFLNATARHIVRAATITIVSNPGLAAFVRSTGGRPCVLPDPLPELHINQEHQQSCENKVPQILFICTWAKDEPYGEVFRAAHLLTRPVSILVTGNYSKAPKEILDAVPSNVNLLGFVSEVRYLELLAESDVVLDLTTRDNCLVCGAYEAVAVQKPLVTSDTAALREYFNGGAVYTTSQPQAIAKAIEKALDQREKLRCEAFKLRKRLSEDFNEKKHKLVKEIIERTR